MGSMEILGPKGMRIGEELRETGSVVETHTISGAPHNVLFIRNILGFKSKAVKAAQLAHCFIKDVA